MAGPITERLITAYPPISDQVDTRELAVILTKLEQVIVNGSEGAIVEFGCYLGTTSLFIRRLLDAYGSNAEFHVYDSFAGLPVKDERDQSPAGEQFTEGALAATKKQFQTNFRKANVRLPHIHKGWFADLTPDEVPGDIAFAFLDGDYYQSVLDSFRAIESKLSDSAVIVVDDYANEALPGAAQAVDEWVARHAGCRVRVEASLAIISL